jgi:hypothetical protein
MPNLFTGILLLTALLLGAGPAEAQKRQRDLITREEILAVEGAHTAYDVVRRIHPEWLRPQSARSMAAVRTEVQVYFNDRKEGDASALRNIQVSAIGEILHLDGSEAESRFGQNHGAGAILISPLSGPRKDSLPPSKPPGPAQSR